MALSTSPRKVVPLASGDGLRPRKDSSIPGVTKRVFYCGVVVEGSENGRRLPEDIQNFVLSFGHPLPSELPTEMHSSSSDPSLNGNDHATQRKRALTDSSALASVINELVTSERSYVKRLQILKQDYADPLRNFARNKDTAILPAYEAKTLFGNVDNLLPVNEAFLTDLEKMMAPSGARTVGGVGDVALRHFKELRGFEQYKQYYVKREDAQLIFEREVSKRSSRFASYIDHIKYQSTDSKNRVGLRELLMEPVQRIPRYTLLFRTMLKHMAPEDPQRAKLVEADEIASKIALAEADEQTKRAAIFYCLTATIDGFPPDLFSNSRRFIDCIDVEDTLTDTSTPSGVASASGSSIGSLHCTLFLFDDKLLIVKRPGNGEKGARVLSGLDELDRVTKAGGIPAGKKKSGMSCKGVLDVTDVVATDPGGAEINLYLENPPQDQSDRWSGRPFRSLSVVHPPAPINMDPTQTEADKLRFLENLWHVQATYRSRAGQSVVLCADEQEVESKSGRVVIARTYFNVYQRTAFLQELKKTKIVVHIDQLGSADPIPFGIGATPFARIRVQPMAGGLCRYAVSSSDPTDEPEEDIVQTERVSSRIVQTIHQFGLFEFRTGRDSRPSTPTARSRVAIFGLDAISRNLFNTRPGSSVGDLFGGSINGHKRTKSTTSRSSMYTQTTSTGDSSLMKFSHRSNSTATAATTVSNMDDDDDSFFASKPSKSKKLLKRGKSPGGSASESESPSRRSTKSKSLSTSRSSSVEPETSYEVEDDDGTILVNTRDLDSSEWNLAMQLELARRNSKNQHGKLVPPLPLEPPDEETIYEDAEDPPQPVRPLSRASRHSHRSTTPRPEDNIVTPAIDSPPRHSRSNSHERRPLGPRTPSPLPPSKSPVLFPIQLSAENSPVDDSPLDATPSPSRPSTVPSRHQGTPSAIPRSKRQPFFPPANSESTPKNAGGLPPAPNAIEPLSIKKKSSVRVSNGGSPMPTRKTYARNSPLSRPSTRIASRRVSPQLGKRKLLTTSHNSTHQNETNDRMLEACRATADNIESSRRSIKRIRLHVDDLRSNEQPQSNEEVLPRPSSPDKDSRIPQRTATTMTKAAQERMEEMRQLIGRRQLDVTPRSRPRSAIFDPPSQSKSYTNVADVSRSIEALVSEADRDLCQAVSCQETLQKDIVEVAAGFKEKSAELERARIELQNTKRQCELVKSLLADATAEKEIMYEAFNEELDGMYSDINLPDDEAWAAMMEDLRTTKEDRNVLSKENSQLKRRIAEAEMQRDEWGMLLRAHGLIP